MYDTPRVAHPSDGDKVRCSAACGSVSPGTKLPFVSLTTCMVLTDLGPCCSRPWDLIQSKAAASERTPMKLEAVAPF